MNADSAPRKRKWDVVAPSATLAPVIPGANGHAGHTDPTVAAAAAAGVAAALAAMGHKPGPVISLAPATQSQPISQEGIERARLHAAALCAKLSQGTDTAPGKPPARGSSAQAPEYEREVVINEAPTHIRAHLLKRSTQAELEAKTKTIIVTKGRYYMPGVPQTDERALYLHIRPSALCTSEAEKFAAMQAAVTEIVTILTGQRPGTAPAAPAAHAPPHYGAPAHGVAGYNAVPHPSAAAAAPPQPIMVFVNITNPPPEFNLPERIRGAGGAFLGHIQTTTGTLVQLRGRGSVTMEGPDPMHVFIAGPTAKAIDDARMLCLDLLKTIKDDLLKVYPAMIGNVNGSHVTLAPVPAYAPPLPAYAAPPHPYGAAAPPYPGQPGYAAPPGAPYYPHAGAPPPYHATPYATAPPATPGAPTTPVQHPTPAPGAAPAPAPAPAASAAPQTPVPVAPHSTPQPAVQLTQHGAPAPAPYPAPSYPAASAPGHYPPPGYATPGSAPPHAHGYYPPPGYAAPAPGYGYAPPGHTHPAYAAPAAAAAPGPHPAPARALEAVPGQHAAAQPAQPGAAAGGQQGVGTSNPSGSSSKGSQSPPRRRFREFVEKKPETQGPQRPVNPYAAAYIGAAALATSSQQQQATGANPDTEGTSTQQPQQQAQPAAPAAADDAKLMPPPPPRLPAVRNSAPSLGGAKGDAQGGAAAPSLLGLQIYAGDD